MAMSKKRVSPEMTEQPELPASFEEAVAELNQLVRQMEEGSLPLEASLAAYKRGSELVKFCSAQLEAVEHQVQVLEDGMLKPFSDDVAAK